MEETAVDFDFGSDFSLTLDALDQTQSLESSSPKVCKELLIPILSSRVGKAVLLGTVGMS